MSSTIFDAPAYDPARDSRRRNIIIGALIFVVFLGIMAYKYRNWPEERVADHFFAALQQKDFEKAYGIWMADPEWKQHPTQHGQYPFASFYQDWGPGGEWGAIKTYKLIASDNPKGGSGVVVLVDVNDRAEKARVWVEKRDKTMTFSPF